MKKVKLLNKCLSKSFWGFLFLVSFPMSIVVRFLEELASLPQESRDCKVLFAKFIDNWILLLIILATLFIYTFAMLFAYTRGVVGRVESKIVNRGSKSFILESVRKAETDFQSQWHNERAERLNVLDSAKEVSSAYLNGNLSKEKAQIFCTHTFNYLVSHLTVEAGNAYKLTYYFREGFREPSFRLIGNMSPLAQEMKPRVFEEVECDNIPDKVGLLSYFMTRTLTSECYDKDSTEWKRYFKRFGDDTFDNYYESMYLYKLKDRRSEKVMIVFCLDCRDIDGMRDSFILGKMEEAMRMVQLERG